MSTNGFPKISIVTPTYNQVEFIEETILSVLEQGYPNLEYIIIDGGSTDGTVEIIKKYASFLKCWVSEKDNGLYEALDKGFKYATGEIMGWINSDDILHRKSFFSLSEIFSKFNEVNWVQGYPTVIDHTGRIVYHRKPRSDKNDFYLKKYHDGIFIQQESTYWRRSLWERAGNQISTRYKYAGDFELWMRFFTYDQLYTTDALIGAFRVRGEGQLSSDNYALYINECDTIVKKALEQTEKGELLRINKLQRANNLEKKFLAVRIINAIKRRIGKTFQDESAHLFYDFKEGFKMRRANRL
jgi:glycosyltransferase involved in cell wall biosynthesis